MTRGLVEVRRFMLTRALIGVSAGIPLIALVSLAAMEPRQVLERAAIGVAIWGGIFGTFGTIRARRCPVSRRPVDRTSQGSGSAWLAFEALVVSAGAVALGGLVLHPAIHGDTAALVGAGGLGIPLGLGLAACIELVAWERIARREQGTLWIAPASRPHEVFVAS